MDETNDEIRKLKLEAAVFRGLVGHLQQRTDVQNIDLMNLSGFCRNCLAKWYLSAAKEIGIDMDYDAAREVIYGMPFDEWKAKYQEPASEEQMQRFESTKPLHAKISGHN
ncbi:MAG: DUF1244 domain-containing protein [Gammaproteobacteria bacterium]|nr:DUF1244 domain-containing protein [Gammaproteobacteria bacterium]MDH5801936.1 DUF1244 domain-containing protein [Gammaproteobacteria bacterium]